jgi:nitrite reductase/ring-hydroxylating ferredoxin subunit
MPEETYSWHKIADAGDILVQEGNIVTIDAGGKQVCVTVVDGEYFAFQSKCPHAGASFEHAWLSEDHSLICPLHRFRFDVRTGRNASGEGYTLFRYPTKSDESGIWIGIQL